MYWDGFLGIGGSAAKTDRKQELTGQGNLSNVFNFALPAGREATSEASGYNSKILSGDRTAVTQALAPEINAITGQADQAKKQEAAMGTSRTGGTNANDQQRQQQVRGAITDQIARAKPEAAKAQANLGGNLLGLGESAAQSYVKNAANDRPGDVATSEGHGADAAKLAMFVMGL